uniref:Centromere protein O n=1 Tax=Aegilops tauschii subsp. strangulata TaxID=200361 RepID=A0A453MQ96_AEGTS
MVNLANIPTDSQFQSRTTYRIRNKVIYCLDGARIGIQYETFFAGEPCEIYHCVLESKSFLEKMTVTEHTLPFFLPIREVETDHLSSNAIRFIDHLEEILQSYIDRREQGSSYQGALRQPNRGIVLQSSIYLDRVYIGRL